MPSDKNATPETVMLYQNLSRLLNKGIMFGHQDDLAYGVGWKNEAGRSDIKDVTGTYPAVYGWDLGHLERDSLDNFDGVNFHGMTEFIKEIYKRGGVNTISWHLNDPATGKTSWSTSLSSVRQILTDPKVKALYFTWLDKFAFFVSKAQEEEKAVPIIYRPFHEQTGDWFWWGKTSCTPGEFKALWKLTVEYLRNEKHLHNLLYAYSTGPYKTEAEFMERYPGDEYVDVVGTDIYCDSNVNYFVQDLKTRLSVLNGIAQKHHKIPALTEVGYEKIPQADWFSKVLLPELLPYKLSYVLAWRNWKEEHFFAPYQGHASAEDFKKVFYKHPKTIFQKDMSKKLYRKPVKD
ncbi:MAG: beta-mannosidase [Sphingobacteriaceae bacterium]|nr:MAG: beta-mannosidase [Sphingobacteriaceae bacterium]